MSTSMGFRNSQPSSGSNAKWMKADGAKDFPKSEMLSDSEKVYIQWDSINYFVPAKKHEERAAWVEKYEATKDQAPKYNNIVEDEKTGKI